MRALARSAWWDYIKKEMLPHMWCPGCGNGIVLKCLARALAALGVPRHKVVVVTGIGCWGKADDYLRTNALHTTHGRALAFATGIKLARPELTVLVLMGDGDCATIGGNHLLHAARRNVDLTAVVVNNFNYGMTGGQVSATTPRGAVTSTTARGNPERGFDLCRVAEAAGANLVARATVYHVPLLERLLREGIQKRGFSFLEVISPCPTHFGRRNRLGTPAEMIRHLKEKALGVQTPAARRGEIPEGCFLIGKLAERDDPDFLAVYEQMRQPASGRGGQL